MFDSNKRSEVYEEVDEDGEDLDEQKSGIGGGYGQSNGLRGGYYPGAGPLPPPGVRPGGPLPPPGVGPLGPLPPPGGRPIGPLPPPGVRPIGPGPPQGVRPPGYYPRPPLGPGPDVDSLINDPTYFEKCTCQPAFNCKQPALIFGSCDVEKQYCCEKFGTPDVLVGPGGPVDPINRRPYPQGLQQEFHDWRSRLLDGRLAVKRVGSRLKTLRPHSLPPNLSRRT
ncbi:hypothetical protein AAG570_000118 [Ranatra chinensis]|uniref:Uncharacterized protein n=1 Tax=Ranatra chinensis TaxID=642074 RepID=A0ABD0YW52_9HEMI